MNNSFKYLFIIRAVFVCLLVFFYIALSAQTIRESDGKVIADIMERLIENTESTVDYTDLQDQLENYIQHKLNINTATQQDFQKLLFLSDQTIDAIIKHRIQFGDFLSIYELQSIESIDENTLYLLTYFLNVDEGITQNNLPFFKKIAMGKNVLFALHENEFKQRAGYDKSLSKQGKEHYFGSPYRYVLKYRFTFSNSLSYGFTGEKDMGEQFFQGAQKVGFDFNSFYLMLKNQYHFKTIALGDFQANFGQGLTFGTGISARKSAYVMNARRNFENIRAYHSLNENEFLRGTAFTYQIKSVEFTGIFSYKYISTNYREADTLSNFDNNFSSIQLTGLHRTSSEILNKDNVLQGIYGGHIKYAGANYDFGFTAVNTFYDHSFQPGNKPYQLYNFNGRYLSNFGVDYNFYLRNINFFGEFSSSSNIAFALVSGMTIPLHQTFDMVVLYRNYAKNYQTTFNNPFAENSDGRNEEGFYTGISFKPNALWAVNSYVDMYRSSWLRYLVDAPSHGVDFLAELQFNPSKSSQFYVRFKNEVKNINTPTNVEVVNYLIEASKKIIRLNANYKISQTLAAVSRFEVSQYEDLFLGNKTGTLIFQDLIYTTELKELQFSGRIAVFSIEDYTARIYANETDVLNQYSVPLYQNSGVRYYLVVHYRFTKKVDAWVKYSQTTYNNVNTISSGLQQINGNILSDLRVQLRWSF